MLSQCTVWGFFFFFGFVFFLTIFFPFCVFQVPTDFKLTCSNYSPPPLAET